MCENCGINHETNELEDQDAFDAFLDRLFGDIPEDPEIKDFMAEYRTEPDVTLSGEDWKQLSDKDKEQIKKGLSDGTFNY